MADDVASQVLAQLQELGWSKAQAAGITANIKAESNFNPTAVGDGGKAYGIAQWHPDRQADFETQFGKSIKDSSLAEQVNFIHHELTVGKEQRAGAKLSAAIDPGDAASIVSRYYERPADKLGEATKRSAIAHSLAGTPMATQVTPAQTNSDLTAAGQAAINSTDAAATALARLGQQYQSNLNSTISILEGSKQDDAMVAETQELAKATAQQRTLDYATLVGTNPAASTEALAKLVRNSNQLFEQQRSVAARIENANNPSTMFDSPVRWLADYLLAPYNKQRLDAINSKLKSTTDQIKWMQDSTQNQKQTMDAISQSATAATAQAKANSIKAKIDLEVAQQRAEALKFNSTNITSTAAMTNNAFSIRARLQDQELQSAQIDEARKMRALQQQALQMSLDDKNTSHEAQNSYLEAVNLGRQNTGLAPFKSYAELDLYKTNTPQSANILAVNWTNGQAQLQGTPPTVASTPYAALTYVTASGANLDTGRANLIKKIQDEHSRLMNVDPRVDEATYKAIRNSKTAPEALNTALAKKASSDSANITAGGQSNLYAPPPLATLQQDVEFQKTYLSQKILKSFEASGTVDIPFKEAISLLLKDVNEGKVSVAEADSDLNFLAAKIRTYNNDVNRYKATAGLPDMSTVKVPVQVPAAPGFFRAPIVSPGPGVVGLVSLAGDYAQMHMTKQAYIDLADPVARSTMFNKSQAAQLKIAPPTSKVN